MTKSQIKVRSELRQFIKRAKRLPDLFDSTVNAEITPETEDAFDELSDIVRTFHEDVFSKCREIAASMEIPEDEINAEF